MKLTVLGSGSPEAYLRRASSGYLLEIGADRILFDCGGGVFDNLLRSGRMPEDITHLFFSHYHSDHMMDYARLVHAAWDAGAPPLKVWGPPPLTEMTRRFFGPEGALWTDLRARTELVQSQQVWAARGGSLPRPWPAPKTQEIAPGFSQDFGSWTIRASATTHAEPILPGLAFRVEHAGKTFVYSGDTGITEEISALCSGADMLIHWCYRAPGEALHPALVAKSPDPGEVARMARAARVKRLYLTHFRVHMDAPEIRAQALADLAAEFGPAAGILEDLDVIDI